MDVDVQVTDGVAQVRLRGDVDAVAAPELADACNRAFASGARSLVIDCAEVEFMDSAGLSALLDAQQRTEGRFGSVTVRQPSDFILRLLHISGLADVLLIEDGPAEGTR